MEKMDKRKIKYINKAIEVLKQDGLRLSLEEIATKMGVSKKTLYNHFSSKDDLLKYCIQQISADLREAFSGTESPNHTAIENIKSNFERLNETFTHLSPIFFHDIMILNPNQAMAEHVMGAELFQQKIIDNLRQGVKEGLYLKNLDIDFVSKYISHSIFGYYIKNIINNNTSLPINYFSVVVDYHLRSIVTEKGRKQL